MPVGLQLEVNEVLTKIETENRKDAAYFEAEYVNPGYSEDVSKIEGGYLADLKITAAKLAAGQITIEEFETITASDRGTRDKALTDKAAERYAAPKNMRESAKAAAMVKEKLKRYAQKVNNETPTNQPEEAK